MTHYSGGQVVPVAPKAIVHEQVTVGTSAVQLSDADLAYGGTLKADDDNTGTVYVGGAGVTTSTGYRLEPGQAVYVACNNSELNWVIGSDAAQKLHFIGS